MVKCHHHIPNVSIYPLMLKRINDILHDHMVEKKVDDMLFTHTHIQTQSQL